MPLGKAPKRLDRDNLQRYAAQLLAQRPLSRAELQKKLRLRAADPADIPPILELLADYGAVDDARFAQNFSTSRLANKLHGPERILRDLSAKQVASSLARAAIQTTFGELDEAQLIEDYLARRYRSTSLPEYLNEAKNFQSVFRRLRLAGYSTGNILKILRRHSELADAFDPPEE